MKKLLIIFLILPLWLYVHPVEAQNQKMDTINLINGGKYLKSGKKDGKILNKFIGDPSDRVIFSQKNTMIYCDSAYLYRQENQVEAFGNVKVIHNDTITVTGAKLFYFGNSKLARMTENVVYTDPRLQLFTDFLEYDMLNNLASYFEGGKLVDESNTLTSLIGNYQTTIKIASFRNEVILENPEYDLFTDTLKYFTVTKVAKTEGPTRIISDDGQVIFAEEGGVYETAIKQSIFGLGQIETESYFLKADQLFADELSNFYSATENVELIAKEDDIIITGEEGKFWKDDGLTKIYGNALMKRILDVGDTLFLSADTLISIDSDLEAEKRLLAYNNVKIYREGLQGIADSMSYHFIDSILYFYRDPVLWAQGNQIEADSINMKIKKNGIERMNLAVNSFLISQDTIKNFNQVKGRSMTAFFKENKMDRLDVYGNGESLFFALDDEDSVTVMMGMNKIICSDMTFYFEENQFRDAKFYVEPDGSFIPPQEMKESDQKLRGFNWRINEKPTKEEILNGQNSNSTPAVEFEEIPNRLKNSDLPIINIEKN